MEPRGGLYKMVTGTLPFVGKDLWELWQQVLSRKYHVPFFISSELEKLLKKLMLFNPKKRGSLKEIMQDSLLNVGQEELRPYDELP